ncbi:hypothetical protein KM043_007086 [Ampulex compressa]|nr:hypothetical protein KM043_007086 [Ampulex compressa]
MKLIYPRNQSLLACALEPMMVTADGPKGGGIGIKELNRERGAARKSWREVRGIAPDLHGYRSWHASVNETARLSFSRIVDILDGQRTATRPNPTRRMPPVS